MASQRDDRPIKLIFAHKKSTWLGAFIKSPKKSDSMPNVSVVVVHYLFLHEHDALSTFGYSAKREADARKSV